MGRGRNTLYLLPAAGSGVAGRRPLPRPGSVPGPTARRDPRDRHFLHPHLRRKWKAFIVEPYAAGLALFDYDNDGDTDIYFLNGAPLPGTKVTEPPRNALYRNDGDWHFTDVTKEAGVGDLGFGLGVAAADYDNDGDLDLYVNNFGPNVLYRNNGDGTFTDVTGHAHVVCGDRFGAGACFLDMDADGDLDLYVANYLDFRFEMHIPRFVDGFGWYPSPLDYQPMHDFLYANNGDGTFSDVSAEAGVQSVASTGMGMICADCDDDGDTDIFVCNDMKGNFLFENDGKGHFRDIALVAGTAFNLRGDANGSMGVDCGDFDNDGLLDFYMTAYQGETPVLYKNLGGMLFEDETIRAQAADGAFNHVNWGTGLVDFDNDGNRDLFLCCGHIMDNVRFRDDTTAYEARNILLWNNGKGRFVNISDKAGDGLLVQRSSRGAGFDDLDNDGDLDVVILNSGAPPTILRNDTDSGNHWLQVHLKGTKGNRDGVGARVKVVAGDLDLVDEVHSGRCYQSHFGMRLQFGLGKHAHVDRVEVRWIGGGKDVIRDVTVDQLLTISEGTSPE